jgi:hypothetical protein
MSKSNSHDGAAYFTDGFDFYTSNPVSGKVDLGSVGNGYTNFTDGTPAIAGGIDLVVAGIVVEKVGDGESEVAMLAHDIILGSVVVKSGFWGLSHNTFTPVNNSVPTVPR